MSYHHVAHVENALSLRRTLAARLGPDVDDPLSGGRANESLIPYLPALVTERSVELVQSLYADDFEVFGYSLAPPREWASFSDAQMNVALKAVELLRGRHRRLAETRSVLSEQPS